MREGKCNWCGTLGERKGKEEKGKDIYKTRPNWARKVREIYTGLWSKYREEIYLKQFTLHF